MDDIRRTLLRHAEKYPAMQPIDAIKLLYQRQFGGGHLIKDAQLTLARLRTEYAAVEKTGELTVEDIGGGMCRVYLGGLSEEILPRVNELFVHGAGEKRGELPDFIASLSELTELAEEGKMPFPAAQLAAVMEEYRAAGYPMVSHSDIYRETYHPAYRVMPREYAAGLTGGGNP